MPTAFRASLLRWYRKHGRHDLPWRQTRDPYAILVSEVMLQQTQVATVLPYYQRWVTRFPDFETLAAASEADVLHAWQGLGYYSRARNLRHAAQAIVAGHNRRWPNESRRLPGVGRYTANAVATFAFDAAVPVVEANIARLLARLSDMREPIDCAAGNERLWATAAALVPSRGAGQFNSALMDLGAIICTARRPRCAICPVKRFCRAPDPLSLPVHRNRPQLKQLSEQHAFIIRGDKLLLEQATHRWRGMWILPRLTSRPNERPVYVAQFPFTNHRVTLEVFRSSQARRANRSWFEVSELQQIAMPSPHRRAVESLLE